VKYDDIIFQHADEAAFIWQLRDQSLDAPHITLSDLTRHDERLEAHLDGLRIAGEAGWPLLKASLEEGEAGEVFVAAATAFESRRQEWIDVAVESGIKSQQHARGLISALGWLPYPQVEKQIKVLLSAGVPAVRRVGMAAMALHRQHYSQILLAGVEDSDPALKARALRAVGELSDSQVLPSVRGELSSDDAGCRYSAAWTLALMSPDSRAVDVLKTFATSDFCEREQALQVALRRMDVSAGKSWLGKVAQNSDLLRIVIIGIGIIGEQSGVPWLIEQMKSPPLARVAGEAFTMFTGRWLDDAGLAGEQPEDFEAGPTENPEDDDVAMDIDENLPWPDPAKIAAWWSKHSSEFSPGTRYLLGKPIKTDWLIEVLKSGRQRQRAAAALELAILQPGKPLFNIRAPGFRQQQWLAGK
jgi:uncharacterized protein (TIGR02270 family)